MSLTSFNGTVIIYFVLTIMIEGQVTLDTTPNSELMACVTTNRLLISLCLSFKGIIQRPILCHCFEY